MAEDDDESFGDFTFASFPPNPTVNIQINAPQPTPIATIAQDIEDDDEWGDFVDFSRGSDPSNGPSETEPYDAFGVFSNHGSQHRVQSTRLSEPATGQTESSKIAQWVKPRGALPLSLFGEAEDEEKPDEEDKSAHIETRISKEETNKLSNGSNTDSNIGLNDIIATLYNQNPQFQSGKPSSNGSEYGNPSSNLDISELGLNSGSLAVKNDFGTVHNSDWNGSGSKSQAVESSSTGWNTDSNKLRSDQTGFSSNTSVDVTNLSERIKSDDSVLGSKTDGLSSDITASRLSFSGWGFDFGEFGSTSKTSNSSFSGFNSNSDAMVVSEKSGSKNGEGEDSDDDGDDGWEFKDAFTEARDGVTNNEVYTFLNILLCSAFVFRRHSSRSIRITCFCSLIV